MYRQNYLKQIITIGIVAAIIIFSIILIVNIVNKVHIISDLQEQLDQYEEGTGTVYRLLEDEKAGKAIEADSLIAINIPLTAIPENAITDLSQVEGKLYKTNLSANTCLSEDMVIDNIITDDLRELDVIMDEIPIGLEEGDFVDVRIAFPLGQDYIGMTKKEVLGIVDNVVKLIVNEEDFYTYQSMESDKSIYSGTKIYAAKYVESMIQKSAKNYYPVSLDILKTRILDPNIDSSDYSSVLISREQLEAQIIDSGKVEIADNVTGTKEQLKETFNTARENYEILQQEKEYMEENGITEE